MNSDRQLIVHIGTGTILDRDECVVIDIADVNADASDEDIVDLAREIGSPIMREI